MKKFVDFTGLTSHEKKIYREAIQLAFPKIILASKVTGKYWNKIEEYFPEFQIFKFSQEGELIGFFNAIPIFYEKTLDKLPDNGWDWLVKKGIEDYENKLQPNCLGGLQVIVRKKYQGNGYSKSLLNYAKQKVIEKEFSNFIIPIRPIKKHIYPKVFMTDYINMKAKGKIFDPWIKAHIKNGAQIIKVCTNSMNISGDIDFWEDITGVKIDKSGEYIVKGALTPVVINVEDNYGEYKEPNIWINYPL